MIMKLLRQIPDRFPYKQLSYEYCKYIMEVTDKHEAISEIEDKLSYVKNCEELLERLHSEVDCLQGLIDKQIWTWLEENECPEEEEAHMLFAAAAFKDSFDGPKDHTKTGKNEKPERPFSNVFY